MFGLPEDASLEGWRIDRLLSFGLIAAAILFAALLAIVVVACLRFDGRRAAVFDTGDGRWQRATKLAVTALVFLGVDGVLFARSTRDLGAVFRDFAGRAGAPGAVRLEINARQWAWEARYPGPDGEFNTEDDVVSPGTIYVPAEVPVVVQLASTDVVHALNIPNLRVKQDAIPGSITRTWFAARRPGAHEIACAQYCGIAHDRMRGVLVVLPRARFDAWLAWASGVAVRAYDADDVEAHWGWPWRLR